MKFEVLISQRVRQGKSLSIHGYPCLDIDFKIDWLQREAEIIGFATEKD